MRTQPDKDKLISGVRKIHNVTILDGSGSMLGAKYESAKAGIRLDLKTCLEEKITSFSFVEFNGISNATTHCWLQEPSTVNLTFNGASKCTPLYRTISETLFKLFVQIPANELVLLKITTDGENTEYFSTEHLNSQMQKAKDLGWTIVFIGTKQDTESILKSLTGLDVTNTMNHDNTGAGVAKAFNASSLATRSYTARANAGEDVTTNFYFKTLED